jgi:hypothetical protein
VDQAAIAAVRAVVTLISRGEYELATAITRDERLSATDIRRAVERYGRQLAEPPVDFLERATVTPITSPRGLHLAIPLWTAEEGPSDLTLELRLTLAPNSTYNTEILDLHVL